MLVLKRASWTTQSPAPGGPEPRVRGCVWGLLQCMKRAPYFQVLVKVHLWGQEEEAGSVGSCHLDLYLLCTQACSAWAQPKCIPVPGLQIPEVGSYGTRFSHLLTQELPLCAWDTGGPRQVSRVRVHPLQGPPPLLEMSRLLRAPTGSWAHPNPTYLHPQDTHRPAQGCTLALFYFAFPV